MQQVAANAFGGGAYSVHSNGFISFTDARRYHEKMVARIRRAALAEDLPGIKKLNRQYLRSRAAKYWAAYRIYGERPVPPKDLQGSSEQILVWVRRRQPKHDAKIARLATRIDPFSRCREGVKWWRLEKRRGSNGLRRYRAICSFGDRLKAQHGMIAAVLGAALVPGPHLYDLKGKGKDLEAEHILAALIAGYCHVYVGDIESSFDSFLYEALFGLPLPRAVVECNLIPSNLRLYHCGVKEADDVSPIPITSQWGLSCSGPRGLLHGSPASNIIQAWMFRDIPAVLPRDSRLFIMSDNVALMCRNDDDCARGREILEAHFADSHAGPFNLIGNTFSPGEAFSRCGYEHGRGLYRQGPAISFDPDKVPAMIKKLATRVLEAINDGLSSYEALEQVINRCKSGYPALSAPDQEWEIIDLWVCDEVERHDESAAT